MLLWLLLISALLLGLLAYLEAGGAGLETVAGWPAAAAVVLVLILLYASATRGSHDGGRVRRLAVPVLILGAMATLALTLLPHLDIAALLAKAGEAAGLSSGPSSSSGSASGGDGFKSVRIRRNTQAQFLARGEINGTPADMLIDTGASAVILRQSDAERAGIDTKVLAYTVPIETANGQTHAAAVRLRALSVGPIHVDGLEALVAAPGSLNESLLGMTFLRRLRSYEISGDFITLRE
ncbi:MAG: TIGR02281 family clan AA aspartic protease [Hyphomicrobium sp.]